ncbi:hypothetical protein GQ457_03G019210 [Hibiscus cannabinus]
MSQSIDKPPYFNGAHYSHWKNRMMIFVQSIDYLLWDVIEDGPTIPMKRVGESQVPNERHEWSPEEHAKVSSCENAKEIWDKLEVVHEGTNETKIGLLNLNYENFKMNPNEDIKAMFNQFSIIKTVIIEAKNLKELKLDELIGSLLTHELMSKPLIRDKEKKIKEQGINVNAIALNSSKCQYEDSSMEEISEEDDEMDYLVKNFTRFTKYEKERSRHEPKKKMNEPQRVQSSNKRGSSSKKEYVETWSDEEDSTDNEVVHLCFMALQEGEVSSTL